MFSIINEALLKGGKPVDDSFFLLMSDVDSESCQEAITWILSNNYSDTPPQILNLLICTPGGNLSTAFALVDVMRGSHIPVRTIGLGEISSAGLLIFMSGEKGERILTPNTSVMSHQFAWANHGKYHELMATVKEYNHIQERLLNHYEKCTKLKRKEIVEKLLIPSDVWLSPEQAVKYGIADKVKELK